VFRLTSKATLPGLHGPCRALPLRGKRRATEQAVEPQGHIRPKVFCCLKMLS